jgi:hypothetical protein
LLQERASMKSLYVHCLYFCDKQFPVHAEHKTQHEQPIKKQFESSDRNAITEVKTSRLGTRTENDMTGWVFVWNIHLRCK